VKIKSFLEQVLNDVYGLQLYIDSMVDENLELKTFSSNKEDKEEAADLSGGLSLDASPAGENKEAKDGMINNILQAFGGEIVS
jgi:hypothetical protein